MGLVKFFCLLTTTAASMAAIVGVYNRFDNCNDYIGDCYQNGCEAWFPTSDSTIGTCTANTYRGCPCEKCGGGVGYVGPCADNGCDGYQGVCTGLYEGCLCD